jgi:hypothetical protein
LSGTAQAFFPHYAQQMWFLGWFFMHTQESLIHQLYTVSSTLSTVFNPHFNQTSRKISLPDKASRQ